MTDRQAFFPAIEKSKLPLTSLASLWRDKK